MSTIKRGRVEVRILFISMLPFESNTSATIQNKGIIRGLSELGHKVDVLTLKPNENTSNFDKSMNNIDQIINEKYYINIDHKYEKLMSKKEDVSSLESESNSENKILRNILKKGRNIIKRIYDNISIFDAQKTNVKGVTKLDINYTNYDIIISASDPKSSHLIADKIYQDNPSCKSKWIQYWGDPMYHDITRKDDWRNEIVKYTEKKLIKKADRIVYASPLTLTIQRETFPEMSRKMAYANQVYTKIVSGEVKEEYEFSKDSPIKIGYYGSYISNVRNIVPLYNAANKFGFKLDIAGYSDIFLENTEDVKISEMVSYEEILKMEKDSDILVSICNRVGTQIPGKIYYNTGYNKPIIIILDGEHQKELEEYLEKFDRFILCENNEQSILEAIKIAKEQLKNYNYKIHKHLTPEFMADTILGKMKQKIEL